MTKRVTKTQPIKLFLTLAEASEAVGLSKDTLRGAVARGTLRAKKTGENGGGVFLFRVADLEAWYEGLEAA